MLPPFFYPWIRPRGAVFIIQSSPSPTLAIISVSYIRPSDLSLQEHAPSLTCLPSVHPPAEFPNSFTNQDFVYIAPPTCSCTIERAGHSQLIKSHCVVKNFTMGDPPGTIPPVQSSTPRHPRKLPQAPAFHQPQPTPTSPSFKPSLLWRN
jgi:hypothetical protein